MKKSLKLYMEYLGENMKRKIYLSVFTFFISLFLLCLPSHILAKETLNQIEIKSISDDKLGAIILYDDLTIAYEYTYILKNIEVTVCKSNNCEIEAQIFDNQLHIDQQTLEYNLKEYVDYNYDGEYTIIAKGYFKMSNTGAYKSANFTHTLKLDKTVNDEDGLFMNGKKYDESMNKVIKVFNTYVIPGIYIALAVLIIIKGILLAIDIVKYADNVDVRREKIKGFIYLAIGIFIAIAVNTCLGLITGLFKF